MCNAAGPAPCCYKYALLLSCCPQIAGKEQIEAVRAELSSKAGGDADAAYEADKQRAGEEKRAELEAQLAAAQAAYEAAAAEAQVGADYPKLQGSV